MSEPRPELSHVLVALMRGVTYREGDPQLWQSLIDLQASARDHVAVLGLELMLDEAEGYAYLRQQPTAEGAAPLPRLVARRPLSYTVSLLLALLRKRLAEFDAKSGDVRLVIGRDEIADLIRLFLPETGNEARLLDRLDTHIKKVVELGFLRPLRGSDDQFEVQRLLKAFVDAQWLHELEQRLAGYRQHHVDGRGDPS